MTSSCKYSHPGGEGRGKEGVFIVKIGRPFLNFISTQLQTSSFLQRHWLNAVPNHSETEGRKNRNVRFP